MPSEQEIGGKDQDRDAACDSKVKHIKEQSEPFEKGIREA
jgi:hypothetical protein